MSECILKMEHISKCFASVQALDDVRLECRKGQVHILAGENGAGKSTILKILSGIYPPDGGTIQFKGQQVQFKNPTDAQKAGIAMVFQELTLINQLTIAENIYLGKEHKKGGLINKKEQRMQLLGFMDTYGIHMDPDTIVDRLSVAQKQLVEILKILIRDPELIILDEPTSSLAKSEVQVLFEIIRKLKAAGKSILFISHRLEEVFEIGDWVTVFKDGHFCASCDLSEIDTDQLIRLMVGRTLSDIFPPHMEGTPGETIFELRDFTFTHGAKPIHFAIRRGEVIGIAGLQGHGQTEFLNALAGVHKIHSGEIFVGGKQVMVKNSGQAVAQGIALIPGDRKQEGLLLPQSIRFNIALSSMKNRKRLGVFIDEKAEKEMVQGYQDRLHIKMTGMEQEVCELSGGNQQKVVLGKELAIQPKVLLFNEPTRGIDVEAKREFYYIMHELAQQGVAILMCSNELMEVIGMSDRVLVMYENNVTAILEGDEIEEENIMRCVMGLESRKEAAANE